MSYMSYHIVYHPNSSYCVSKVITKMKIVFGLHEFFFFLSQMLSKEMMSFGILRSYCLCFVPARIARCEWLSYCHFKEKKRCSGFLFSHSGSSLAWKGAWPLPALNTGENTLLNHVDPKTAMSPPPWRLALW